MYTSNPAIVCEYIWIGGNGEFRSKKRVIDRSIISLEWNYDASSTGQATSNGNTEGILRPVAYFNNPLNKIENHDNMLILCATYDVKGNPLENNCRHNAEKIFETEKALEEEPWYGLEQEYFMIQKELQFFSTSNTFSHYCGTVDNYIERLISEKHFAACLEAGLKISGINAEVSQYQWEFQIGPCVNITAADQLVVARYLLERIAEEYNVEICYNPKPELNANGSGCHTNFSTNSTRQNNIGIQEIYTCMKKLEANHEKHIAVYGTDNEKRLTGHHETASFEHFSWGIGTRNTSIRIPNQVVKDAQGYFEDRRPAANMDPYQVTSILFETCYL